MHSIPVPVAEWQRGPGETLSVYRTSQGQLAVQRNSDPDSQQVFDSVSALREHVPAELAELVERKLGAGRR
jgi:hypothetical protein